MRLSDRKKDPWKYFLLWLSSKGEFRCEEREEKERERERLNAPKLDCFLPLSINIHLFLHASPFYFTSSHHTNPFWLFTRIRINQEGLYFDHSHSHHHYCMLTPIALIMALLVLMQITLQFNNNKTCITQACVFSLSHELYDKSNIWFVKTLKNNSPRSLSITDTSTNKIHEILTLGVPLRHKWVDLVDAVQ